jgi:hypothetical protein
MLKSAVADFVDTFSRADVCQQWKSSYEPAAILSVR